MTPTEQDTRDLVFRALDHARANGYTFEDWPAERVAVDLLDYEANLEGREPADVYPHVAAWLRAYPSEPGPQAPLVNDVVVDPDGTRDVEHPFETLGPQVSDGFCRRCGRAGDHALHRCEWSREYGGERRCAAGSTTRVRFGPRHEHEGWYCDRHAEQLVTVHAGTVVPRPLTEDDVPAEVWTLLDRLAGRPHSAGGSVRRAVVEVLTALGWRP